MKITIETNEKEIGILTSEQSDVLDKLLKEIGEQNSGIKRSSDKGRMFITEQQFDRLMDIRDKS